jgi:Zn-dependent protease
LEAPRADPPLDPVRLPDGSYVPVVAGAPAPKSRRRGVRSATAGSAALLAILSKFQTLLVLLKVGKFTGTFLTMIVSIAAYAAFFGVPFALGLVVLLFVHEMGHWVVLRAKGVAASAPVFIPFIGAVVAMRGRPRNVKDEAEIGIGGPIAGTGAALLTGIAGALAPAGTTQNFLYALGYAGLLLNLFNLIPVSPLDGGRIVAALSRWAWPLGLAILVAFFFLHPNGVLLLILVLGGLETLSRFFRRDRMRAIPGYYVIAPRERAMLAVAFFGLLVVGLGGMELLHNQLLAIQNGTL